MKNPLVIFQQQLNDVFVRIYTLPDVSCSADDLAMLSVQERHRLSQITHPKLYVQKIWSYVLKRLVLGEILSIPPETLVFKDDHGKPRCDGCYFNISHTGNFWAIAWCQDKDVGIDIEQIDEQMHWQAIMRQFFTLEEQNNIQSLEDFFTVWTQKEALLKLQGKGIAHLKQIHFIPDNVVIHKISGIPGILGCVVAYV